MNPRTDTLRGEAVVGEAVRPVRLRLSRARGFNLQAHSRAVNGLDAVNVCRPSKWGNPYSIAPGRPGWWDIVGGGFAAGDCSHRTHAGARMVATRFFELNTPIGKTVSVYPLRGRNLACWCALPAPGEPDHCHAAVLLRLSNRFACEDPTPSLAIGARP